MKITFIHHSSFAVEVEDVVLVFDYFEGDRVNGFTFTGVLPEWDKEKSVYFFASHKHQDHFDRNVLKLADLYPDIHFILSKDTKMSPHFMSKHGIPVSAKEKITYVVPDSRYTVGKVEIETLRSTDAGVAFLVKTCGKTIYHAGDLHNWRFEGAGDLINGKMERGYKFALKKLEDKHINAAFVVLDGRLGIHTNLGLSYFMRTVDADYVFPMHMWQDFSLIGNYKKMCENRLLYERIVDIDRENQEFDTEHM